MRDHPRSGSRRPRLRRAWLAALLAVALAAVVVPVTAGPAAADTAPLVTEDGIGIRLDETALTGPALAEIENSLQPFVDQMIYDGATDQDAPFQSAIWVQATSDLNLSFDVLPPDGSRPSGGVAVHADIANIVIQYRMDPIWPFADCSIWVRPDTGTVDVSATVDKNRLPATPLALDPIQATWDDEPSVTSDGVCWTYVAWQAFVNWWNDAWNSNDPESTASKIEHMLNDTAQGLIDDLWGEHVAPVLDSLESFGVTVNQLHTDDHGLIVTGNTDATDLTIPGLGGPFDVSGAEDSGADSDVNALLANRVSDDGDSHAIVSVHPNVANQFLHALNQTLGGNWGQSIVPAAIEQVLIPPANQGSYSDAGWSVRLALQTPAHTEPTGGGGAPQLQLPQLTLRFFNTSFQFGVNPVATFSGSMDAINLMTEIRSGSTDWGPGFDPAGASASLTLTQGNSHVMAQNPNPADVLPYAKGAIDFFNDTILVPFVTLAPISIGSLSVDVCSTCGRYAGDERYTETFKVT